MIFVILLMMLSKNRRSEKIRHICQQNNWQYQEFINFTDSIKAANLGLLNYSQNIIFRHIISADDRSKGIGFNFFDCRSIEPSGIHNCSALLFNLTLPAELNSLHVCFSAKSESLENNKNSSAFGHSGIDKKYFDRIRHMQKLKRLTSLFPLAHAFPLHEIFTNNAHQLEKFLAPHIQLGASQESPFANWLLAHPHLHIEISNGMLLAYQPNYLLDDEAIIPAIDDIARLSLSLSSDLN